MSGKTVTDKRIDSERWKTDTACCAVYQEHFPAEAGDEDFWRETAAAEIKLATELEPRPLGRMEVRKAFRAYTAAFKKACDAGRQRARGIDQTHRQGVGGASGGLPVQGARGDDHDSV